MKKFPLIGTLVILVSLTFYVYLVEIRGLATKSERAEKQLHPIAADASLIHSVLINTPSGNVLYLEKKDKDWFVLDKGKSYPADNYKVKEILSELVLLKEKTAFVTRGGDLSEFGLSPPRAEIVAKLINGEKREIYFGGKAQVGNSGVYYRTDLAGKIYISEKELGGEILSTAESMRDKKLLSRDDGLISSVDFRDEGKSKYRLIKGKNVWEVELSALKRVPGNNEEINGWLNSVLELNGDKVVSEDKNAYINKMKFKNVRALTFSIASNKKEKYLYIAKKGDETYAWSSEKDILVHLDKDSAELFNKVSTDFRSRTPFNFDISRVGEFLIEIRKPEENRELRIFKKNEKWFSQDGKEVDVVKANSFLRSLNNINVDLFLEAYKPIDDAALKITVSSLDKKILLALNGMPEKGMFRVEREDQGREQYLISSTLLRSILNYPDFFRN